MLRNPGIEIKWAFIFSVFTLCWILLEKWTGLHSRYIDYHMYLTNLFAIPAIWLMVMALKDKKKNFYQGRMYYMQGLVSGLLLSVLIALLSPFTQWISSYVIAPEYFPNIIKRSVELGHYKNTAEAESYFNYRTYAVQGAVGALIMGLATTAIAMIFIHTKKSNL